MQWFIIDFKFHASITNNYLLNDKVGYSTPILQQSDFPDFYLFTQVPYYFLQQNFTSELYMHLKKGLYSYSINIGHWNNI